MPQQKLTRLVWSQRQHAIALDGIDDESLKLFDEDLCALIKKSFQKQLGTHLVLGLDANTNLNDDSPVSFCHQMSLSAYRSVKSPLFEQFGNVQPTLCNG